MQFTYHPYGKSYIKYDKEMQKSFKAIFADLEKYGRAFTENPKAPKKLAFALKNARDNGFIRFAQERRRHESKSLIVLKPGFKLKLVGNHTIKLYRDPK